MGGRCTFKEDLGIERSFDFVRKKKSKIFFEDAIIFEAYSEYCKHFFNIGLL